MDIFNHLIFWPIDNVSAVVWAALCFAAAAMVWLLTVYLPTITLKKKETAGNAGHAGAAEAAIALPEAPAAPDAPAAPAATLPAVSIIIYACENALALARMLPDVLAQDYAGDWEVIVINDGLDEGINDVVNHHRSSHPHLRMTYVPRNAHNLSRRKLGITLGIKAAKYDVLLLTCANCRVASPHWLALMAAPFAAGKEVVLGAAAVANLRSARLRMRQVVSETAWLSAAQHGRPYRGTGYNLAYSRHLFFDNKGFSRSLHFDRGDDDLFINDIANGENTAVVLDSAAHVSIISQNPEERLREDLRSHRRISRLLPHRQALIMHISSVVFWLWAAAVIVGIIFSLPCLTPAIVMLLTVPAVIIPIVKTWRRNAAIIMPANKL